MKILCALTLEYVMMNSLEFTNSNLLTKQCNGIATQQLACSCMLAINSYST